MGIFGEAVSALLNTFTGAVSLLQKWRQPGDAQSRRDNASMRSSRSSMSRLYSAIFSRKVLAIEKEDPATRSSLRRIVRRLRETLAFVFRSFSSRPAKGRDSDPLTDASESSKSHATKSKSDRSHRAVSRASKSSRRSTGRPTSARSYGSGSGIGSISSKYNKVIVVDDDERREKKPHRSKDEKRRTDKGDRKSEKRVSVSSVSSTRSTKSGRVCERKREKSSDYGDGIKTSRPPTSRRHEERKERKGNGLSSLLKRKKL